LVAEVLAYGVEERFETHYFIFFPYNIEKAGFLILKVGVERCDQKLKK
jgi:hypothetical protein